MARNDRGESDRGILSSGGDSHDDGASKAGLIGLTRAAAKELGPHGITVNAICPGIFDTDLARGAASAERLETLRQTFPMRRLGRPQEVADLICFVASESAGYITGASLDINGGSFML